MRVVCLGGGPAGIYLAISMKVRNPAHEITVVERNRAGDTFGWGVVFSDQTLNNLRRNDALSTAVIADSFAHWDDIEVWVRDDHTCSSGHGFIGIGRKRLLNILQDRARELGVDMRFETEFDADLARWADYDLIVAADGINSQIRNSRAEQFGAQVETRSNKFIWLGTTRLFDAFAFLFEETPHGWVWAHAYRFDGTHSTFIIECSEATWREFGFDTMDAEQTCHACEAIFARHLQGHSLINNQAHLRGSAAWINFRRVLCERWSDGNVVLLGDAAHTAHFSIGSGTKLALEDAITLADVLNRPGIDEPGALARALADYGEERQLEVLRIQNSARNSTEWFETVERYLDFELPQFAYSLLTRSQRVSHENLRQRDPVWLEGIERWFSGGTAVMPMFTPLALRGLTLANRVVVSPVLTYRADPHGMVQPFHLVHYGARAMGGAGLLIAEMTAVLPEGRTSCACPGLWSDSQIEGWRAITDFVHAESGARIGVQLGHAGARAGLPPPDSTALAADWQRLSASALPWGDAPPPAEMTEGDMDAVCAAFVAAAKRADAAGFDLLELQAGHGFLLSSFITPAMNLRQDSYGGPLEARMRFPLRVVSAVRAVWPEDKPLAVRISAHDWIGAAGIQPEDAVEIARMLKAAGVDLVDVSSGETAREGKPVYGRMYQTPFADRIRNEAGVATMAVGNIYEVDHVNSILAAGRADLVALGRPHLADPVWTLRAAALADYKGITLPAPYRLGQGQLARNLRQTQEAFRA